MDVDARLEIVEDENEMLREQVAKLESLLGIGIDVPLEYQLTGNESRVFGVLMTRDMATKEMIMAALYTNFGKDEAEIKIVDVFICKMRKKLKPFGIEIKTQWGTGYYLNNNTKRMVRRLLDERKAA